MQPGTVVAGRYRVEAHLASGGMGAVYRARHTLADRVVALKILRPTSMGLDVADVRRFRREATAAAHIGHPGIVEVLDAGVEEGFLFLVMELLEGESLRARRRHATRAELLGWIRALLDPLAAAHEKGFVHRDLKPENVFLARTPEGERLKLLDFGIARSIGGPSDTRTGTGLGTPGYMAPEQALEARGASPAADVWSVGVMLYETITGRRPFEGETPHATILRAVSEPHAPLVEVAPELAALVDACLAKRPADRPRDARELRARLDALPPESLALDGTRLGPDELATDPDRAPTRPAMELDEAGFPITRQTHRVGEVSRRRITTPHSPPASQRRGDANRASAATPTTADPISQTRASGSSPSASDAPVSDTPVGRLTPHAVRARSGFRVGVAAVGVLGLTTLGWLAVRATENVEAPPAIGAAALLDAGVEGDAETERSGTAEDDLPDEVVLDALIEGDLTVGARDVRFALRLPRGWSRVESPVPTVAASLRASDPVGAIVPSANLVIEPFDGDTRAYVALGLQNAAPVSTTHGQRVVVLRGAPGVQVEQTFHHGERPYRARTYVNVVDGVGVVLSCYADPDHAPEVAPSCDAIAASLVVQ
ncbi:MAG: serine/threonine protein kinase [Myxococcota bacterium]|nr:serine/threonine protein kinase [Myxococcota bacterium]